MAIKFNVLLLTGRFDDLEVGQLLDPKVYDAFLGVKFPVVYPPLVVKSQ